MTCIVGITDGKTVYLGGDSAGTAEYDLHIIREPKVFTHGSYVMGFTSSFRMGQILQYSFDPMDPPDDPSELHRFMCTKFVNSLMNCLIGNKWGTTENGRAEGGQILVGVAGQLFEIDEDFHVSSYHCNFAAIGGGDLSAKGSLHTTGQMSMSPQRRLEMALEASACLNASVAGPFHYVESPALGSKKDKKKDK